MKKLLIATGVAVIAFATVASAATFSTNLTIGSTGADVVALQDALISAGHSIPAIASGAAAKGYFGSQTKTAVMAYQASKGIPNTGFVGPLTRAALSGMPSTGGSTVVVCPVGFNCTPVGGGAPVGGSTVLSGTDGTISDVSVLSQYSNEEVGDGQSDVKVLGFEVEASNEGDIVLKSIKVVLTENGTGDSDNLDDYIEAVSVWMGSTEVGSADVSAFNEDSNGVWSKTITLKSGTIVKADDTEKFYVAVDSVSNLDSGDIDGLDWSADVTSIRFEDGSGVTTTYTSSDDATIGSMDVAMDFVNFSAAADTELKLSTDSSSPEAGIVMVDDESDTDSIVLLVGKLRLDGDSDVVIDELPVTLTGTASSSLAAIANSVTLKIGSEEYTETVSTTTNNTDTIVFDNLDFDMSAGSTVTFTILADVNDINATALKASDFNEGYVLKADVTTTNRGNIDAENEEGDQLTDSSEMTGSVVGEDQEFRTEGLSVALVSTNTSVTAGNSANDDVGLFTLKFKVTAFGESAYLSSTTAGYTYALDKGGTSTSTALTSASIVNNTDTDLTSIGSYLIEDGETEQFTLTVSLPLSAGTHTSGQYRVSLTGVKWSGTDELIVNDNTYASELDSFKTDYAVLN